jgi:hypothetical protein
MNRREALSAVGFLMGGTIIGAEAFLSGCTKKSPVRTGLLTADQVAFLDEVGETILPATPSSPGAKEAKIGEFIDVMLKDCYTANDQKILVEGITKLDNTSKTKFDKAFVNLTPEKRHELLLGLEAEAFSYRKSKKEEDPEHYYSMMKQMTLLGYFSSEVGATKALNHVAVPGRYEACVPLKPGQKAWS